MREQPIAGLSDQRYFHIALMSPRVPEFKCGWLWREIGKQSTVREGRFGSVEVHGSGELEFRTIVERARFAGSIASREALAVSGDSDDCAFDGVAGTAGDTILFGTGYAALTRTLIWRLVSQGLLSQVWFLAPKLGDIVRYCRGAQGDSQAVRFSVTGFNAFLPDVKKLSLLKLGGTDVFGSGLVEQIEEWLTERGRGDEERRERGDEASEAERGLDYQVLRLTATGTLSGKGVSITFARDGGTKMWLRKDAANVGELAQAIGTLKNLGLLDTTATAPKWAEEAPL